MNETLQTIHKLRSIRKFSQKEISNENLETILEATIRTANSGGRQVYSIIVVDKRELLDEFFYHANKALVFCVDYNRWFDCAKQLNRTLVAGDIMGLIMSAEDALLASQTAAIAAKSLGIDSLFTSRLFRFNSKRIFTLFNLPEKYCFPVISLCLGYPEEEPPYLKGRIRKGIIHYNKYQRLSKEEINGLIKEYDDPKNHYTTKTKAEFAKEGAKGYLDSYFKEWDGSFEIEEITNCYETLKRVGFFDYLEK